VRCARWAALALVAGLALLLVAGLPYYVAPIARRVRHPWHPWLRPSGALGQSLGLLALAMFLFLWLYPLRKKLRRSAWLGPVPLWLEVHIVCGMLVPLVAAMHAGWRFEGLIGLGYLAMLVVCLSGFVGRYLYVRIPRSRQGVALTLDEVATTRRTLLEEIADAAGRPQEEIERRLEPGVPGAPSRNPLVLVARMLRDDIARRRVVAALRREMRGRIHERARLRRAAALARREMALAQQVAMLDGLHRLFRWWHAAHRPFALTALIAVLLHVAVAIAMGQTWLR
jgi:hypothetical protein